MERHAWLTDVEVQYLLLARAHRDRQVAQAEQEWQTALALVTREHKVPPATPVDIQAEQNMVKLVWREAVQVSGRVEEGASE